MFLYWHVPDSVTGAKLLATGFIIKYSRTQRYFVPLLTCPWFCHGGSTPGHGVYYFVHSYPAHFSLVFFVPSLTRPWFCRQMVGQNSWQLGLLFMFSTFVPCTLFPCFTMFLSWNVPNSVGRWLGRIAGHGVYYLVQWCPIHTFVLYYVLLLTRPWFCPQVVGLNSWPLGLLFGSYVPCRTLGHGVYYLVQWCPIHTFVLYYVPLLTCPWFCPQVVGRNSWSLGLLFSSFLPCTLFPCFTMFLYWHVPDSVTGLTSWPLDLLFINLVHSYPAHFSHALLCSFIGMYLILSQGLTFWPLDLLFGTVPCARGYSKVLSFPAPFSHALLCSFIDTSLILSVGCWAELLVTGFII